MQAVAEPVAVADQLERAKFGVDRARVDALDGVLGLQAVADQLLDRADLEPVRGRERLQLRPRRRIPA